MNHTVLVRVVERICNLTRDGNRLIYWKLLLAGQLVAQGFTFHERHREPETTGSAARIENAKYVWVLKPCSEPDLALESLGAKRFSYLGMKDLDRDWTLVTS